MLFGISPVVFPPKAQGVLYGWGNNLTGGVGDLSTTNRSSPVQVGDFDSVDYIILGFTSTVGASGFIRNGALYTWGSNSDGRQGHGDASSRSSPVQVGSLTDWSKVSSGNNFTVAIKTDGTMWAWGDNAYGQLGDLTQVDKNSPIQVGSDSDWAVVATAGKTVAAIKTGGTLYTWGYGTFTGVIGDNSGAHRSSPVQIGALTDWVDVRGGDDSFCSVKANGTLWVWGQNYYSKLMLSDATNRSSPTQVGALTDWESCDQGDGNQWAIKTDGTLWSCGRHDVGGLGDPTKVATESSPIQVGSTTTWNKLVGGKWYVLALRDNGTLFGFGLNSNGALGDNSTSNRSSPVQIGTENDWQDIGAVNDTSFGIRNL